MSEMEQHYIDSFNQNLQLLTQQRGTKLRKSVDEGPQEGEGARVVDQFGEASSKKNRATNSDTVYSETPRAARWVYPVTYDWNELIDKIDKVKVAVKDPTSKLMLAGAAELGRNTDEEIASAYFADAKTGPKGAGTAAFPSSQQVIVGTGASGATGMNFEKILAGLEILRGNEVDLDFEELWMPLSAKQLRNLENEIKVTSREYNAMYDTTTGKLKMIMGINLQLTEKLPKNASNQRRVPLYAKSGMYLGVWTDVTGKITPEIATKNYATQVHGDLMIGATRTEEKKVVEIICAES